MALRAMWLKRSFLIIFILCFSLLPNNTWAWSYTKKEFKEEVLSPVYERPANQIFLYGSLLTLSLKIFGNEEVILPFQKKITERNRLGEWNDRVEIMGRWVPNLLYTGGMGIKYYFSGEEGKRDEKDLERSLAMMKATLYAGTLTLILKHTFRQQRPGHGDKVSFPSGHTTTAFAFAAVVGSFHEWYYAVPAYALASAVGFQRLTNNNHYLHDVLMGATIGISYGIGVSKVVQKKDSFLKNITLLPIGTEGVMMGYNYTF